MKTKEHEFEPGYTGDGFTHQEYEDFAIQEECDRFHEQGHAPLADVVGRSDQLQPEQECYKSGEPCKYRCSGLCKESC